MKLTIKWLEEHNACTEAVDEFKSYTGNVDSIAILKLLIKKDKLNWANWLVVRLITHKQKISYAIFAAEQVIGLFEKEYPNDKRPRQAIEAAKSVLRHNTKRNKEMADASANAATYAAANAATYAATYAADAATYAATYAAADAATYAAYATYAADAADAADAAAMKIKIIKYGIRLLQETKGEQNGKN